MKARLNSLRTAARARQFAREIVLACAITIAALIMFLVAREPTEVASVPPDPAVTTERN